MSAEDQRQMAQMGFVNVEAARWAVMRPWLALVTERWPDGPLCVFDVSEVVVFSFFDGKQWRIQPCFFLSYCALDRDVFRQDLAAFKLFKYIGSHLGSGILFEKYYGNHVLWTEILWPDIEEALKMRGSWSEVLPMRWTDLGPN
jgi:hypothetical protein